MIKKMLISSFRIVSIALWVLPDVVMFLTTIIVYVILRKLTAPSTIEDIEENATASTSAPAEAMEEEEGAYTHEQFIILKQTCKPMNS